MAQSFVDPIGGTLVIPAAYPSITVAPNNSGLSTTGVLVLLGEADSGPSFSEETDLADNAFAPDDLQSVVDKYKSGRIVDAFRAAATAAVDPGINGAFSRAVIVKTNTGVKATSALVSQDGVTAYSTLRAKLAGALGSLINYTVTNPTSNVAPTTGSFTYIPSPGIVGLATNASGGIAETFNVSADTLPPAFVTQVNGLTGVDATGGAARTSILAGAVNMTITVAGAVATFTLSALQWEAAVTVGDTLYIPAASGFIGAGSANRGYYVVETKTNTIITARKLADHSGTPSHVAGAIVNPVAVTSTAVNATRDNDFIIYAPVTVTSADSAIVGAGRSLEFSGTTAQTGDVNPARLFYVLGTNTPVTWLSLNGASKLLTAGSELSVSLNANRSFDNVQETYVAGGEVGLKIGYDGYSCTIAISETTFTLTYKLNSGDSNTVVALTLASYPTIADLANYVGSISGFSASPGTNVLGNLPSSALDKTVWGSFNFTYNAASTNGAQVCRIKTDAYRLRQAVAASALVEFSTTPYGGLNNAVATRTYLSGGARGATTAANTVSAVDALEKVKCNFVVPLFSRDASADIVDAQTDSGSTYTIDGINSYVKSHVHKMSTMKAKRNRQAFLSKRDTYTNVSEAAANIASFRCSMVFEDVKSGISGTILQYQPWLGAVLEAATQAAAFYKSLVRKQVNITGALQAAGDWTYNLDSDLEKALIAGLNPIKKADEGGFVWVSDQTTYGKDSNNVYNSVQMIYAADTVALTTASRMDRAFVGQSVADVSAAVALSYLDGIMADFLRLKLIAPSSDAPLGYKNAKIVIQGPVMRVSVEIKIAGSIYFIPISFYVTEITQSA